MKEAELSVIPINRCNWSVRHVSLVWDECCGSWNLLLLHAPRDQREDSGGDRQGAASEQVRSITEFIIHIVRDDTC